MRSRFLTEADLLHFQRNGARVRGSVDSDTQRIDRSSLERERGVKEAQPIVQFSAPAPSRYEYQGQAYKSKTEVRYAMHLDALKHAGEIVRWQYEPVNFRLPGKKNFYCPDFMIERTTFSTPVFVDTKGWNRSDDRSLVKIKTAAGLNRWATFKQMRWIKGEWIERRIEP